MLSFYNCHAGAEGVDPVAQGGRQEYQSVKFIQD